MLKNNSNHRELNLGIIVSFLIALFWIFRTLTTSDYKELITSSKEFKHHLQGIAADTKRKVIYISFTDSILVLDRIGNLLNSIEVPIHSGDIAVHENLLLVPIANNFNKAEAISQLNIYNAKSLDLIKKISLKEVEYGAGTVLVTSSGRVLVAGGLPKGHENNYIYEYDLNFNFIKKWTINTGYTHQGIQTMEEINGILYLAAKSPRSDLRNGQVFKVDLSKMQVVDRLNYIHRTSGFTQLSKDSAYIAIVAKNISSKTPHSLILKKCNDLESLCPDIDIMKMNRSF